MLPDKEGPGVVRLALSPFIDDGLSLDYFEKPVK
jgi:hypothetical protein